VYCLADGSALIDLASPPEQETVVLGRAAQMRVDVPSGPATAGPTPSTANASAGRSNVFLKVLVALLGIGFLVAAVVAVGMFVYFNQSRSTSVANTDQASPKPATTPSPKPDETDELRVMIANLERQIEEQKRKNLPINVPSGVPNDLATTKTARVDSPGDGFLALRTLPNSEFGERILKIPHGATVAVGACGPVMRPISRSGRWCQARYNGRLGWVFDGYLVYE
jgi:hypothetical protein